MPSRPRPAPKPSILVILIGALAVSLLPSLSAAAHGFSSVVYIDVGSRQADHVRSELQLEYDLLVVSAADARQDDALFRDGTAAFEDGDDAARAAALEQHIDSVLAYVDDHYRIVAADTACTATRQGPITMTQRQGAPYAVLTLDSTCTASGDGHVITSTLFPDAEGYVVGTKTILSYAIDAQSGSAALDADQDSFSTRQTTFERFWEFFRLGAEHLLTGVDHICFLLALIAGSRRLREVVLAATAFTAAHSVTFILAATGLISAPSRIVEPVIALSIAVVAGWYLWRLLRRGDKADRFDTTTAPLGLDRAGWIRLAVVFVFGLVHGLGFASALGIDEPWSWTLLWSLLVFNVGIETVQLGIIAVVFPLLMLLRRRAPRVGRWTTGTIAGGVLAVGIFWFLQRVAGV